MIKLVKTLKDIQYDILTDFGFKQLILNYFFSARFRVLLNYRIGRFFAENQIFLSKYILAYYKRRQLTKRSCDISYKATIGRFFKLPHPIGIVIGEGVIIGEHVTVFQHVTLGSHGKNGKMKNYPRIEDNVTIYTGATIIGGIVIGRNSIIGANSVVNIDVPANSIAVGIPCKILQKTV